MANHAPTGSAVMLSQLGSTSTRALNATDITDPTTQFYWDPANGGNGHIYEVHNSAVTWTEAKNFSEHATLAGVTGYLVTSTSAAENAFLTGLVQSHVTTGWDNLSIWLGATDLVTEGNWQWVTGPETGTQFWLGNRGGSAVNSSYSAWLSPGFPADYNTHSGGSGTSTNPTQSGSDFAFLDAAYLSNANWVDAYSSETASSTQSSPVASSDGTRNAYVIEYSDNVPASVIAAGSAFTQGKTLYADASQITDPDGVGTIAWQWQRSSDNGATWANISGATQDTYTLAQADVGQLVRSGASYVDGGGTTEKVFSAPSAAVAGINAAPAITSNGAELTKIGPEFLVNTATENFQVYPDITALTNGGFVVTWQDGDPPNGVAGSATLGDTSGSSIKAQIFGADGTKISSEFLVNTQTGGDQLAPHVAPLANGAFVVTWWDNSGTLGDPSGSIKGQMFAADGSKIGSEFLVNSETANDQTFPTITALSSGGFVVTWQDGPRWGGVGSGSLGDASGASIKAQIFGPDGAKVGSESLVNTETGSDQLYPRIAGLSNGGYVVTWYDFSGTLGDSGPPSIKAQVFGADGAKVGTELLVNTETASGQWIPSVTGLANGGFVVTWSDDSGTLGDSSGRSAKAQIFSADGTKVGGEFLVNTQTAGDQGGSMLVGLKDGGFMITWSDYSGTLGDTSASSIKAQAYDASGHRVGGEFLVNTETLSGQHAPVITALDNGKVVISWSDQSGTLGDTSGHSIKAQIFDTANSISVSENSTAVTTITAADPDASTILGYSISGGADAAKFQIDSTTGALSFKVAPNFEAPTDVGSDNIYDVVVQVSDGALTDAQALAVTVTNVNEAPKFAPGSPKNLLSDPTFQQSLGTGAWFDWSTPSTIHSGGTLVPGNYASVNLHGDLVDWFPALRPGHYTLSFSAENPNDWAAKFGPSVLGRNGPIWQPFIEVQAHSGWTTYSHDFEIAKDRDDVIEVSFTNGYSVPNPSGTVINIASVSLTQIDGPLAVDVAENSTVVTTVKAADVDAGTTLTYSITGGADAAQFQIDSETGALSFKTAPNFEAPADAGANNVYDVIVQASDGSLTDTQALAVTVTNINEAPSGGVSIAGTATVGSTLTASRSVVDPDGQGSGDYQWMQGGTDITGATGANYTLTHDDAGQDVAVRFVYTDGGGFHESVSSPSLTVAGPDYGVWIAGSDFTTGENGDTAVFAVSLNKAPVDPVTIQFDVSDSTEGALSTSSLTFTSANWNTPQSLTVTGVDDYLNDGNIAYNLLATVSTQDPSYQHVAISPIALVNDDDGQDARVTLYGDNTDNTLTGMNGDDRLYGAGGMDELHGGRGNDRLYGEQDNDRLYGGDGQDQLYGGYDDDQLYGDAGNDKLYGEAGNDHLEGGAGNDIIDGGTGADTMIGGAGNDTYYVDDTGDVIDDQGAPTDVDTVLVLATIQYTLAPNIENASLNKDSGDSGLTGNTLANDLTGNDGRNALAGGAGNDTLDGGAGNDALNGGTGNDVLVGGAGNDAIAGGTGTDTADFTDAQGNVSVDLVTNRATGDGTDTLASIENVTVGNGNDVVTGNDGANRLNGGAGNDQLTGGGGDDALIGGNGDDTLYAGNGNDTVNAGSGNDLIIGGDGAGNDRYEGGTGVDTIKYTSAKAGIAVDLSAAKDQAASIVAGDAAGIGIDQLSGIENVIAGKYGDQITGNSAANILKGMGGNDTLTGGAGNDKLYGGTGKDTLTGGTGKDTFIFDTAPTSRDAITDFSRAEGDKLQLSKAVFTAFGYTGALHAEDFYAAAGATTAHDATDRLIYNTTTGVLYYDADGLGGSAAVQVAQLGASTHPALAYSDLQIIA